MRKLVVILILLLVAILAVAGFIVYNLYGFSSPVQGPTISISSINRTVIGESQIYLLLYSIKAYELHSPPLSSNTPKINIAIGNQEYKAEVVSSKINIQKGSLDNADLKISCDEQEFVKILNSQNFNLALQDSVKNGKTSIAILAGNT
ncbi:MAG: hypothetical protein NT076_02785 [Candidatus Pacearchaeota archaeon]|nr:hypothetical protein [Candidatus Pacearchaeota archaeon]